MIARSGGERPGDTEKLSFAAPKAMYHKKIAALVVCCAILAGAPASAGKARKHDRQYAQTPVGCPLHRAVDGTLVDCHGWRWRDNSGWDNSCFNLDYLPSQFA